TVPSTLPQPPGAPDVPSDDDELPLFWTKRLESGLPLSRSGAGTGPPPAVRPLTNPPDLHVSVPRGVKLSLGPHVVVHQMSPSTTTPWSLRSTRCSPEMPHDVRSGLPRSTIPSIPTVADGVRRGCAVPCKTLGPSPIPPARPARDSCCCGQASPNRSSTSQYRT